MAEQASQDGRGKPLKDFSELDSAIFRSIQSGVAEFPKIRAAVWRSATQHGNRNGDLRGVIESRLQFLRQSGAIVYDKKRWRIA